MIWNQHKCWSKTVLVGGGWGVRGKLYILLIKLLCIEWSSFFWFKPGIIYFSRPSHTHAACTQVSDSVRGCVGWESSIKWALWVFVLTKQVLWCISSISPLFLQSQEDRFVGLSTFKFLCYNGNNLVRCIRHCVLKNFTFYIWSPRCVPNPRALAMK